MDFNSIATLAESPYIAWGLSAIMFSFIMANREERRGARSKLNSQLAEKTKELESLSSELIPLREKVHILENSLTDKDRETVAKADEILQKDEKIRTLENSLTDKDREAVAKADEISQKDEKIRTLENSLTDKDRETVAKADEISQKDEKIRTLENQTVEMRKKMELLCNEALFAKEETMKIREELEKTRLTANIMTIEVDRKDKGDDFNILDLKLFHRDCGGGLIIASSSDHEYFFKCKRCDVIHGIDDDDNNKLGVVNTAINGMDYVAACSERGYIEIKFMQKQSAV